MRILNTEKLEQASRKLVEYIPEVRNQAAEIHDYPEEQALTMYVTGFLSGLLMDVDSFFDEIED